MALRDYRWPLIGSGILATALAVVFLLGLFAPQPETQPPPPQAPLVSTTPIEVRTGSLQVRGTGTVQPVREIELTAEVGGRLVEVSDALVSGGRFDAGETLARIDPSDYRSAVQQAEAQVTQAKVELLRAQEEAGAARRDYERIEDRTGDAPEPDSTELGRLVFNEPQVAQAQSKLESANAALRTAEMNLERTRLRVPFQGRVRREQVDRGAYVAPGTPIATVYGTEAVDIGVALPTSKAALLPSLWATAEPDASGGPPARVTHEYGGTAYTWDARVHRVEGALNEKTRTVEAVVRVDDPYRAPEASNKRPPLAVGTYATVDIQVSRADPYHVVPRRAVHRDTVASVVWTVDGDSMLVKQRVTPLQTVEEQTYLEPTLDADTRVVTTDLQVHSDSMRIRVAPPETEN